jgi:hypothetical protein
MKRVKIIISAVLVMAVVAGALAFKAKDSVRRCLYEHTTSTNCPLVDYDFIQTTLTVQGDPTTICFTTLAAASEPLCPETTTCACTIKTVSEQ